MRISLLCVLLLTGSGVAQLRYVISGPVDTGFGGALSFVDDVDGDGHADIVTGLPSAGPFLQFGLEGRVRVFSGLTGALIHDIPGSSCSELGSAVDGCVDVDGDGVPDIVASAPENSAGAGTVYVFSGADGSVLRSITDCNALRVGQTVRGIGDHDGDGRGDFLAAASFHNGGAGEVRVYSGLTGATMFTLAGTNPGSNTFGRSVEAADVDGDGTRDFIVGEPLAPAGPRVVIFSGVTGAVLQIISSTALGFGSAIAAVGDVDGDGAEEYVVGAFGSISQPGMAFLFSGLGTTPTASFTGDAIGDGFGRRVASIADLDGDGRRDLVISALGLAFGAIEYVRAISSASGVTLATLGGVVPDSDFGAGLATADTDGDGEDEILIGASRRNVPFQFSSGVYVVSTADLFDYPGHADDLRLRSRVGAAPLVDVDPLASVPVATAGNLVVLAFDSPGGGMVGAAWALLVTYWTGTPMVPDVIPGAHVYALPVTVPYGTYLALDSTSAASFGFAPTIPPGAIVIAFNWPVGLGGTSILYQAIGLGPLAANGFYAASNGHEIRTP